MSVTTRYGSFRHVPRLYGPERIRKAAQLQKKADELAKEIRLLDNKIQQANWTADLME